MMRGLDIFSPPSNQYEWIRDLGIIQFGSLVRFSRQCKGFVGSHYTRLNADYLIIVYGITANYQFIIITLKVLVRLMVLNAEALLS